MIDRKQCPRCGRVFGKYDILPPMPHLPTKRHWQRFRSAKYCGVPCYRATIKTSRVVQRPDLGYAELHLLSGAIAKISPEDAGRVEARAWHLASNGYVRANAPGKRVVYLHTLINGRPPAGMNTDHINRDRLDNRRENLRFVTPLENSLNSKRAEIGESGIVGVQRNGGRWIARRQRGGRDLYFGSYATVAEAAEVLRRVDAGECA